VGLTLLRPMPYVIDHQEQPAPGRPCVRNCDPDAFEPPLEPRDTCTRRESACSARRGSQAPVEGDRRLAVARQNVMRKRFR